MAVSKNRSSELKAMRIVYPDEAPLKVNSSYRISNEYALVCADNRVICCDGHDIEIVYGDSMPDLDVSLQLIKVLSDPSTIDSAYNINLVPNILFSYAVEAAGNIQKFWSDLRRKELAGFFNSFCLDYYDTNPGFPPAVRDKADKGYQHYPMFEDIVAFNVCDKNGTVGVLHFTKRNVWLEYCDNGNTRAISLDFSPREVIHTNQISEYDYYYVVWTRLQHLLLSCVGIRANGSRFYLDQDITTIPQDMIARVYLHKSDIQDVRNAHELYTGLCFALQNNFGKNSDSSMVAKKLHKPPTTVVMTPIGNNPTIIKKGQYSVVVGIEDRSVVVISGDHKVGGVPFIPVVCQAQSATAAYNEYLKLLGLMCIKKCTSKYFANPKLEEHCTNGQPGTLTKSEWEALASRILQMSATQGEW